MATGYYGNVNIGGIDVASGCTIIASPFLPSSVPYFHLNPTTIAVSLELYETINNPGPRLINLLNEATNPVAARLIDELGCKCAARIILADSQRRIDVPNRDEWIGVNLLEHGDQLPRRKAP
jgi:hypothetical protein